MVSQVQERRIYAANVEASYVVADIIVHVVGIEICYRLGGIMA